ncbi:hypothetical protein AO242_07290 [Pseudomonas sp. ICMP 561]|nr:hypothetical protein AO242_07290 [Pseudomonas sp. ICMP 561]
MDALTDRRKLKFIEKRAWEVIPGMVWGKRQSILEIRTLREYRSPESLRHPMWRPKAKPS